MGPVNLKNSLRRRTSGGSPRPYLIRQLFTNDLITQIVSWIVRVFTILVLRWQIKQKSIWKVLSLILYLSLDIEKVINSEYFVSGFIYCRSSSFYLQICWNTGLIMSLNLNHWLCKSLTTIKKNLCRIWGSKKKKIDPLSKNTSITFPLEVGLSLGFSRLRCGHFKVIRQYLKPCKRNFFF